MESEERIYDDEITLKELILKIQEYWRELWRNWLLIGLIALPFFIYKVYDAYTTPPVFPGKLTFMVDEDEGGSFRSISGLLGQFGFNTGSTGKYNLDKILEISKSRRVVQMALFSEAVVGGKKDLIANHIIEYSDLPERWSDDTTGLKDFRFREKSVDNFSLLENRAFKGLLRVVNGTDKDPGIYQTSYDDETGIMSLEFNGRHPDLSIAFLDSLFFKLRDYYVENSIEKAQTTYQIIKEKTDSVADALAAAEYSLADFIDRSQNVYSAREGELQRSRLSAQVSRLQILYGEAMKNLQLSEMTLRNKEPFITLIDSPLPPLTIQQESLIRSALIGIILGTMIGVTFILGRKIYRDTMNS